MQSLSGGPPPGSGIPAAVWDTRDMRDALAERDVSSMYRLLRREGVSQRQIAAQTGQSQSEVSEILKGRQVIAYDVLARIADGLGVPRGYMGLAYDEQTEVAVATVEEDPQPDEDEAVKRRRFLAHAAAVTMGAATMSSDLDLVARPDRTPAPNSIGMTDVRQIEAATRALRSLDYQYGGGFCRDAVIAQLSWGQQMLSSSSAEPVRDRLFVALADLHNLAGWTSFDTGKRASARTHFGRGLELAREAKAHPLVANILYRMGRVYLHEDASNDALKLFQLGQLAAQESGSGLAVSVLCANEAWAYAQSNMPDQAVRSLGRSKDEFERADRSDPESWVKFFNQTDVYAMTGTVHSVLAQYDRTHTKYAVPALERCLAEYDDSMARSRTFMLSMLATDHLIDGNIDYGAKVGRNALEAAAPIKSGRVKDRMRPLLTEAEKCASVSEDARDLSERLARYLAA